MINWFPPVFPPRLQQRIDLGRVFGGTPTPTPEPPPVSPDTGSNPEPEPEEESP